MEAEKQREVASKGGQRSHGGGRKSKSADIHATATATARVPTPASKESKRSEAAEGLANPDHGGIAVSDGDLVRYKAGANMTEGIVLSVSTEPFTDNTGAKHRATLENPIAKLENQYTKHVTYHHIGALEFIARKHDYPGYIQDQEPVSNELKTTSGKKVQKKVMAEKEKMAPKVEAKVSPVNLKIEKGDFVRYKAGRNYTAGVVLDMFWTDFHDETGKFHHASSDAPMVKIENLWSKHANYHHMSALERIQSASAVEKMLNTTEQSSFYSEETVVVRIPVEGERETVGTQRTHKGVRLH